MANHGLAMTLSDVKQLTGALPAVTAFDLGKVGQDSVAVASQAVARDAVSKGMLVMMASHVGNLVTGGSFYVKEDHGDASFFRGCETFYRVKEWHFLPTSF